MRGTGVRHGIDWAEGLALARNHTTFLARALDRQPDLAPCWRREIEGAGLGAPGRQRRGRCRRGLAPRTLALALALAVGDLAGALPLMRVVEELSGFADRALDAAIAAAIARRAPDAEPVGFSAIALGKHGAQELNYSSDIDPILLYDPEVLPRRARDEPGEAAQRVARGVVELLSTITDEGYVFRIDLRLRPASEVSPLAIPFEGAITHYESSALAWERAAYIRARAASGDVARGQAFLDTIRPFVWRRSLDFGAIAEIGRLTARIRDHYAAGQQVGPGYDLKRGRGGIREVEFFAQTHQLIHGGRNPALRLRGTRAALDALAEAGIIAEDDALVMGQSYDRLRVLEHRLQMVADQQTHALPVQEAALAGVARLCGHADGGADRGSAGHFAGRGPALRCAAGDHLAHRRGGGGQPQPGRRPCRAGLCRCAGRGAAGGSLGQRRIPRPAQRRGAGRLARVRPHLLQALAEAPDPDHALARWERLLAALPSAINVFRLLEARPGLMAVVMRVLAHAPTLAEDLARRADLLDTLIDHSAFALPGTVDEIRAELARGEVGDDYQRLLDAVRRKVGELRFALGVQLVEGLHPPLAVAAALSRVAEAAIAVLGSATEAEFARVHGHVPDARLVVLGLGRLGGGALTHASDLDLVFLFGGPEDAYARESDGGRPIGGTLYFNRLAQRMIAALSVPTAAGALYEVDTRLRPSGAQGPIAVSLDSFERYQREDAWTWEHMALCRARPLFGAAADRAALAAIVARVLHHPREAGALRSDVLAMREEMARHKPAKGPLDVKLARGGLVDLEFLAHFLQLRDHVALEPDLGAAVSALEAAGLLPPGLRAAHDLLAGLLVVVRLVAPDGMFPHPPAVPSWRAPVARQAGTPCLTPWPGRATASPQPGNRFSANPWRRNA
jgi:glutamate-ammonia-ligase adenylyltransferase